MARQKKQPEQPKAKSKALPRKRILPAKVNGNHTLDDMLGTMLGSDEADEIPIEQVGKRLEKSSRPPPLKDYGSNRINRLYGQYKPDYPEQAAKMVLNGATEKDMIVAFKTTMPVFRLWQLNYPDFAAACTIVRAASLMDARVERSIYEMANGYDMDAVKIFNTEEGSKKVRYKEQVPRNFNAAKFWLMNRDPERWGRDPDSAAKNTNSPAQINIGDIRGMTTEQIRGLIQVLQKAMTPNQTLKRLDTVVAEAEELTAEPSKE